MDWITDLLKHLAIKKSVVVAVFITAIVMVFGPNLFPDLVPSTPQPWPALVFGVMVLSGTLILFWALDIAYSAIVKFFRSAKANISSPALETHHYEFLLALGKNPSEPLDLDNLDYDGASFTKLEIMQWALDLKNNNLVKTNPWNENLISLTSPGRTKALEIQRNQTEHA